MGQEVQVKANPNPIQRNLNDVAMELTTVYLRKFGVDSAEDIQRIYAKFYAVALATERVASSYKVPENFVETVMEKIK